MRMLRHLRASLRRGRRDEEMRDELNQHVAWKAEELEAEGVAPDEARRLAAVAVGNVTRLREDSRAVWGFPSLDGVAQDLRYACRQLRRAPAFTATAVFSLAVGIGTSAAVFSVADAMLFRTLAVWDPESLVVMKWLSGQVLTFENLNGYAQQSSDGISSTSFAKTAFDAFRADGAAYVDIAAFADLYEVNLAADGRGDVGNAHVVDGRYFQVLGVEPILGRALGPEDDRREAAPAAAISYAFWKRQFGGAADAVGRIISVNAVPFTIAGVLPAGFRGTGQAGSNPDVYVTFAQRALVMPGDDDANNPNYWWVLMMGRLKPGVRSEDARAGLDLLLKRTVSAAKPDLSAKDLPRLALLPGARGQVEARDDMRSSVRTMALVTSIVLLVACANVANLLLARGRARVRELSVRAAIGASRGRIIRQLVTEAGLLSLIGSAAGVLLARWLSRALLPALSSGEPLVVDLSLDWRLLAFMAATSSAAAMLFGLVPAFRSTDVHLSAGLEEGRRGLTPARRRKVLAGGLVAVQIALSLVLLTSAGLLARSIRNLSSVPLGFDPANVLLFRVDASLNGYDVPRTQHLYGTLLERFRATPGVLSAALSSHRLISNSSSYSSARRPDEIVPPRGSAEAAAFNRRHGAYILIVGGDFFSTMTLPIVRGRSFTDADAAGEPVAVVNRALARRLFGTEDVEGRQLRWGPGTNQPPTRIVGVCGDAYLASVRRSIEPTVYLFFRQQPGARYSATFELKTAGAPEGMAATVRDVVRQIDPTLPVARVGTQSEQVAAAIERERLFARLATLLGLTAVMLAAIGLYGLLSYAVVQRTAEIGVRMALGAARGAVRWMVLRESFVLVAIGLAAGLPAAFAGTRLLDSLLFELPPGDPVTLSAACVFMVVLASAAAYVPARRASGVDPAVALRAD